MKHSNIAIFVPHAGCPYQCAFCDQRTITEQDSLPRAADVERICAQAMAEIPNCSETEIAFFGGSFTAIPHDYMTELLEAAQPFLGEGKCRGIRISTRPDCIDAEILTVLRQYGVTSIELGAQSMSDKVLAANDRGHTAEDVTKASRLIREFGFELGLQVMPGLYRSTEADERLTIEQVLAIKPDTLRIYPVVLLKGTRLAALYVAGAYELLPFEQIVGLTALYLMQCRDSGIRVIKCGLHASEFVERDRVGGFYHPAFREICEGHIYRTQMEQALAGKKPEVCTFAVHPGCVSKAVGHQKANTEYFRKQGISVRITSGEGVPIYECELIEIK